MQLVIALSPLFVHIPNCTLQLLDGQQQQQNNNIFFWGVCDLLASGCVRLLVLGVGERRREEENERWLRLLLRWLGLRWRRHRTRQEHNLAEHVRGVALGHKGSSCVGLRVQCNGKGRRRRVEGLRRRLHVGRSRHSEWRRRTIRGSGRDAPASLWERRRRGTIAHARSHPTALPGRLRHSPRGTVMWRDGRRGNCLSCIRSSATPTPRCCGVSTLHASVAGLEGLSGTHAQRLATDTERLCAVGMLHSELDAAFGLVRDVRTNTGPAPLCGELANINLPPRREGVPQHGLGDVCREVAHVYFWRLGPLSRGRG